MKMRKEDKRKLHAQKPIESNELSWRQIRGMFERYEFGEMIIKWDSIEGMCMIENADKEIHFFGQIVYKIDLIAILRSLENFSGLFDEDDSDDSEVNP